MNRISDKTFQEYYQELFSEKKIKIASESDDYIIAQPTEDLVKYYQNDSLQPIEFDSNKQESIEHKKSIKTIYANERESAYRYDGDLKIEVESIIVKLPIVENQQISTIMKLRTNTISFSPGPTFTFDRNNVVIEVIIKDYQVNLNNEQLTSIIISTKEKIQNLFITKNKEINIENEKLKNNLTSFINQRKEKLDGDNKRLNDIVNLIKIPLARKDGDIIKKIQVDKKPFVLKIKPRTLNEDYQLDREKVLDIIKLMNNQCLQFEKTPKTYEHLDEPNLRDLLLSNLNSIFEGQATGETFNNKGKTDIYLNIDKGNILVSECKIYGGEKLYHKTIEQLLGYLTWRQNYGIMINFCNQKNFSKIVDDAKSIITSHSSYESSYSVLEKAHFVSKHTLPGDDYKYVEIHHLYYNLYVNN